MLIDDILYYRKILEKYSSWDNCVFEEFRCADNVVLIANILEHLVMKARKFQPYLSIWA